MDPTSMVVGSDAGDASLPRQYLSFRSMQLPLALAIDRVREIIEFGPLTAVPMMPPCVRGVMNLRGNVVAVIDLALRFGGEETRPTRRTCIVILDVMLPGGLHRLGLMVDAVDEVVEIGSDAIEPPPDFGAGISRDCILGMARRGDGFVTMLDPDRVIGQTQFGALQRAVEPALLPAHAA